MCSKNNYNLYFKFSFISTLFLYLVACQPKTEVTKEIVQVPVEKQADSKIENSFSTDGDLKFNKQNIISIEKSALGKIFLFAPAIVTSAPTPMLEYIQAKTVSFEKNGDQVVIYEQNMQTIYDVLPVNQVLQSFPIVDENDNKIYFKWDLKLSYYPSASNHAFSDSPQSSQQYLSNNVLNVLSSNIKSIEKSNEALEIQSELNVKTDKMSLAPDQNSPGGISLKSDTTVTSLTVITRIIPYAPNPKFTPLKSLTKGKFGFFEVLRIEKETGKENYLATRWDFSPEKGPITYFIGDNIPAEYKDAVVSGILYWNKVFGREVIKVETNSKKIYGGYRQAVLHWIPDKSAGFARATMQSDPLTGEIITANVYMTSVFTTTIDRLIDKEKNVSTTIAPSTDASSMGVRTENTVPAKDQFNISLNGFLTAELCNFEMNTFLQNTPGEFSKIINPEIKLALSQDIVRMTVAHEVGHSMGLRHNFAGSLDQDFDNVEEQIQAKKDYASQRKISKPVSSTVMDYLEPFDDGITGAIIDTDKLKYDQYAIQWGYTDSEELRKSVISANVLFCTDSEATDDANQIYACDRFDSSKFPFYLTYLSYKNSFEKSAQKTLNEFIKNGVFNTDGTRKKVTEFSGNLTNNLFADNGESLMRLMNRLKQPPGMSFNFTKSAVEKKYDDRGAFSNSFNYSNSSLSAKDFEKMDGALGLFKNFLFLDKDGSFAAKDYENFIRTMLLKDSVKQGKTTAGIDYTLSDTDINDITEYLTSNASTSSLLSSNSMDSFLNAGSFDVSKDTKNNRLIFPDYFRNVFLKIMIEKLLFSGTEATVDVNGTTIKYIKYQYPSVTRKNLLTLYMNLILSQYEKPLNSSVKNKLVEQVMSATGKNLDEMNTDQIFALFGTASKWPADLGSAIKSDITLYQKLFLDSMSIEKEKIIKEFN